jgi:hypothetical protein
MSLLSTDISKVKRLSLKEIKPPAPGNNTGGDKAQLIALAQRLIEGNNSYSLEDIIARIKEATNVNQERAERGFNLLLQSGVISRSIYPPIRYYLTGSYPF